MKTVRTPKGTELPLVSLKSKDYLMVAYRIQWMNEETPNFDIQTEILKMEKDESVVKATVSILGPDGRFIKKATATKREDSKGFADHLEKAETSSIGRALALLGFGTQFAIADLDEGNRLADSPLEATKQSVKPSVAKEEPKQEAAPTESKPTTKPTFKKPSIKKEETQVEGWD